MNNLEIPIFKKTYEFYKTFYSYRNAVPKQDRHTIWQKCETLILEIIENIFVSNQLYKSAKLPVLENASVKLNMLRVFLRLMKETKTIDNKKYLALQETADEIGRMLGGWIKSLNPPK